MAVSPTENCLSINLFIKIRLRFKLIKFYGPISYADLPKDLIANISLLKETYDDRLLEKEHYFSFYYFIFTKEHVF